MTSKSIIKALLSQKAHLVINKTMVQKVGLTEAALLSVLCDGDDIFQADGDWFFATADKIQEILCIKRFVYDSALKNLVARELIETKRMGLPAKKYFKLNYDKIIKCIDDDGELSLTLANNQVCCSPTNSSVAHQQSNIIKDNIVNIDIINGDDDFEKFWDMYDRKVAKPHCQRMWAKLTKSDKAEIFERLPAYIAATPDKQYRMHPATYINPANKRWQDEIIDRHGNCAYNTREGIKPDNAERKPYSRIQELGETRFNLE